MSGIILVGSFVWFVFSGVFACEFVPNINTSSAGEMVEQSDQAYELRKILTATVFQGIANSCQQLGKVAGAKDKKEKHKEACNFVASFFKLAADVAKEKENKAQGGVLQKQQEDTQEGSQNPLESRKIIDEAVTVILGMVDEFNGGESESLLRAVPSIYLFSLSMLPDDMARDIAIRQILNDDKKSVEMLLEVTQVLNRVMVYLISDISEDVVESLKIIIQKEAVI